MSIHSEIAKTIWDDLITHKGIKDLTKETMESNVLNFNEAIQQLQIQRLRAAAGGEKVDLNYKNRGAELQKEMLLIKDDLLELAKFYSSNNQHSGE